MTTKKMTADRFRQVREDLGLSQHKMALMLGYENRASVSLFESGKREISPRLSLLMEMLADQNTKERK